MIRPAIITILLSAAAQGQDVISLEQAVRRSGPEFAAANEGRTIAVRGQVASGPVWALGMYYISLRDDTDHGLLLKTEGERSAEPAPGDWVEVRGKIQSRSALPLLAPGDVHLLRHDAAPEPKDLTIAELNGFRYLGLLVRTSGTVTGVGENLGGRSLDVSDHGHTIAVFFPRPAGGAPSKLAHVRVGDHVRLTGLATQYSLEAPHNGGFQLMLTRPDDVEVLQSGWLPAPAVLLSGTSLIAFVGTAWWMHARRQGTQRRSMRAFHALSEEIISAASPSEIAEKLGSVLPQITQATGVRLYLYNRRSKSLELVPTKAEPDPMAVPVDGTPDGLANGAVAAFRNRTLLNVPDVRRSPIIQVAAKLNLPRSAMFVPLFSQHEVLGVLEVGNARRMGYFSVEEQAAAQHLANQVAASLKLQEQQTIREQLFRSEKLAATGQLISGVASELRTPLDSILQLATSLAGYGGRNISEHDLRLLAGESQRASEIVSRLVSFARPEDSAARLVDVNGLVANLMQFRDPEWKTLGLRVQNRLPAEPAMVLGAQGQIEQVFLNLLVHAEQCASEAPGKTIVVSSSSIARRVTVDISYSVPTKQEGSGNPFLHGEAQETGALGLGVCQGIVHGHGGEIRFGSHAGTARFEIDLPLAVEAEPRPLPRRECALLTLTLMVVEPDAAVRRQTVAALGARGHRAVPVPMEQAPDLAQRMRFDAALWAIRPSVSSAMDYQEKVRAHVPCLVLVSDAYDAGLAHSLESSGGFLLARPVQEADWDRLLEYLQSRMPNASTRRAAD